MGMDLRKTIITDMTEVMTIDVERGVKRQIPTRRGYGISFCATPGGKIVYRLRGREFVSDYQHVIFLPKGQTYMLYGIESGSFPLINFDCAEPFLGNDLAAFPIAATENYLKQYEKIRSYFQLHHVYWFTKGIGLLYEMLSNVFIDSQNKEQKMLMDALSYMKNHFSDPGLTVTELARLSNISESYFRRLFAKYYHTSPKQYILDARLNKAKELLSSKYLSIAYVAETCGFSSIYYFDRMFRACIGCTPTEYNLRYGQLL